LESSILEETKTFRTVFTQWVGLLNIFSIDFLYANMNNICCSIYSRCERLLCRWWIWKYLQRWSNLQLRHRPFMQWLECLTTAFALYCRWIHLRVEPFS